MKIMNFYKLTIALLLAPVVLLAQADSKPDVVLDLPGQGASSGEVSIQDETISVDYPDEDVRTILRSVADLYDLNLVIPDGLQGRTSIKLKNITWDQVFEVVLDPLGYTYIEDRNIIRIKSIQEITAEPVDTRIFIINYARAEELKLSIESLVDPAAGGNVQVDVRSNALIVRERPSRMSKIDEVIQTLDKATDQVMIESKFVEIRDTDTKNIGINWTSLSDLSASVLGGTAGEALGGAGGPVSSFLRDDEVGEIKTDVALFTTEGFEAIIQALDTNNDIELISNPTVVALNNTKARISIGRRIPLPQYSFNNQSGLRQLNGFEYLDIGVNLDVTPSVNEAGFINLNILPEVSSSTENQEIEGTNIPIITSRRTESNITIKDGYTLAIGGLVAEEKVTETSKVPLLGGIPGLGRFFRSSTDSNTTNNLIIFITAKTLNPDGSTYRDVIDPRILNDMNILPSDVPGYQVPEKDLELLQQVETLNLESSRQEEALLLQNEISLMEKAQDEAEQKAAKEAKKEAAKKASEQLEDVE